MRLRYGVYRIRNFRLIMLLAIIIASCGVIFGHGGASTVSSGGRLLPIYSVDTPDKKVSLGINCAWDNLDIPDLIRILDEHGVKATFFVSGSWCVKYPESVKALFDAGHELGSHSNTHADLTKLGRDEIIKEILLCNEKIKNITGFEAKLFRMPSGAYNNLVIETIKSQGMTPIQWDCDSVDYKNPSPEEMQKRIMSNLRSGSITLFHSGAKNTPSALPGIIKEMQQLGYEIVPVSELIYPEPYTIDFEGRQHKK